MSTTDTFGITKIHPTKSGGRTWTSKWHNTTPRVFKHSQSYEIPVGMRGGTGVNQDPQDNEFMEMGAGSAYWAIDGSTGIATWKQAKDGVGDMRTFMGLDYPAGGTFPPYEFTSRGRQTWLNVEMTGYPRIWKITIPPANPGPMRFAVRSNHFNIIHCQCDALGYSFQYELNPYQIPEAVNRLGHHKEIIHPIYSNSTPSQYWDTIGRTHWDVGTLPSFSEHANVQTFPLLRWVGMKFIVRDDVANGKIRLEHYRDMTNGRDGGNWIKMSEINDNGVDTQWGARNADTRTLLDNAWASAGSCGNSSTTTCNEDPVPKEGNYNPLVWRAGHGCYMRVDGCTRVDLKWFSIREIDPIS